MDWDGKQSLSLFRGRSKCDEYEAHHQTCKRRLFASILLIIPLPILCLGSLTVLFSMGRPIFFLHERSGQYGKPFRMVKLRTMVNDQTGKLNDSERVTRAGLLLRKFSIDELPQLLNVLGGSMSLVGPRPLLREYDKLYSPVQARRLQVKPGLTGLAQLLGGTSHG